LRPQRHSRNLAAGPKEQEEQEESVGVEVGSVVGARRGNWTWGESGSWLIETRAQLEIENGGGNQILGLINNRSAHNPVGSPVLGTWCKLAASNMSVRAVLFLCTGNYYRSRFAEGLFNHLAGQLRLGWRADSCGLALGDGETVNAGSISIYTLEAFELLSIPIAQPIRPPRTATLADLTSADLIIALKEAEHRALMRQRFPDWEGRVTYWHVHDLDQAPPHLALAEIEELVRRLIASI
jgi:protein-tyrosine phosphatase